MADRFQTISPVDGSVVFERDFTSRNEIKQTLERARSAFEHWRRVDLDERRARVERFIELAVANTDAVARELTMQIGRPIRDGGGEVRGWLERGRKMVELAPRALADVVLDDREGFTRFIRHEPLGVVAVLAPWNYPWLTSVNALAPALVAGNTVVLKHSEQTPLVAERIASAAVEAQLPEGVLQVLYLDHDRVRDMITDPRVAFVAFTGSVEGGRAIQQAAASRFIGVGLELGGKDPAYVCNDADIATTAVGLVDGAFYNAGQSCCAVERIYVHRDVYDPFIEAFVAETKKLILGDPRDTTTTLGPVVRVRNAEAIQKQIDEAIAAGARSLLDANLFPEASRGLPYMPPTILVDVDHGMQIMSEETFGPAIGVMSVADDAEAITLMNDSQFGLTASVWTEDLERAQEIGGRVETGTWFLNRCDYLDPELAWVGVKNSGRGCSLSTLGYAQLTRPKSFHLRHTPG
ncbi:MAG: aldehyde dehydrogenase family protein [Myxococcales bacterium]|nr:aldehyde dehydrogenase family protein [Myxococcales bacterium]MDH3485343.1 aldehyde dehydrogenase family protein [Myxococcales bacterium]